MVRLIGLVKYTGVSQELAFGGENIYYLYYKKMNFCDDTLCQ